MYLIWFAILRVELIDKTKGVEHFNNFEYIASKLKEQFDTAATLKLEYYFDDIVNINTNIIKKLISVSKGEYGRFSNSSTISYLIEQLQYFIIESSAFMHTNITTLTFTIAELYKELYDKLFEIGEAQSHEPLIDVELFDKVQKAFKKDCKPERRKQHYFLFSGMLTCAKCGSAITAEIKKGKYIYYHCANKTGGCENKGIYVKQEILEKQFEEGLKSLQVTPEHKVAINTALKESFVDEQAYHKEQIIQLNTNCEKLRNRISQLYNDKLDGLINVDLWQEKNNEWTLEHSRLNDLIEKHMNANKSYMEQGTFVLELLENLYLKYIEQNDEEKRNLIKIVSSNFLLDGEKLSYEYKKPFNLFAEGLSCQLKWRIGDSNS